MKPPSDTPRRERRLNSALAGGVFLTINDIMNRWGVTRRTALARIRESRIASYNFTDQCVRYRADDIMFYEQSTKVTKAAK